jgi:regulator of replication initiation timing
MSVRPKPAARRRAAGGRIFLRFVFDGGPGKRENWSKMNAKGWILWVCLAVIFVSLPLLFYANYQRNAAQADARDLRQQISQLQSQLDDLKSSSVVTLGLDNARLRAENQGYSQKLAKANSDLTQLAAAKEKVTEQLMTARKALQMQQDHLQQLTVENQQQAQAATAPPPPPALSPDDAQTLCVQNLHVIDSAKQSWAVDNSKEATDVPTAQDLLPYLKGNTMPACPSGGTYTIGAMNEQPSCSVPGHALPQQ